MDVGGSSVLAVGAFDPSPGAVLLDVEVDDRTLASLADQDPIAWFEGRDVSELTAVAARAAKCGIAPGRIVLEPDPAGMEALVRSGFTVACAPERFGFLPGGPLEAVVTEAVMNGVGLVRTEHVKAARRCMDVTAALLMERSGAGA